MGKHSKHSKERSGALEVMQKIEENRKRKKREERSHKAHNKRDEEPLRLSLREEEDEALDAQDEAQDEEPPPAENKEEEDIVIESDFIPQVSEEAQQVQNEVQEEPPQPKEEKQPDLPKIPKFKIPKLPKSKKSKYVPANDEEKKKHEEKVCLIQRFLASQRFGDYLHKMGFSAKTLGDLCIEELDTITKQIESAIANRSTSGLAAGLVAQSAVLIENLSQLPMIKPKCNLEGYCDMLNKNDAFLDSLEELNIKYGNIMALSVEKRLPLIMAQSALCCYSINKIKDKMNAPKEAAPAPSNQPQAFSIAPQVQSAAGAIQQQVPNKEQKKEPKNKEGARGVERAPLDF